MLLLAGLSPAEILHAGTRAPADYWGLADLGAIEVGRSASLLVLDRDPLVDPLVLAEPSEVWSRGRRRR
jgi:imidazolonepropionase-like amidohydrolase